MVRSMPTDDDNAPLPPEPFHPLTITGKARELIDRVELTMAMPRGTLEVNTAREAALDAFEDEAILISVKLAVVGIEALVSIAGSLERMTRPSFVMNAKVEQ